VLPSTATQALYTLAFSNDQMIVTERSGLTIAARIATPYEALLALAEAGTTSAASAARMMIRFTGRPSRRTYRAVAFGSGRT
jgi:hypothetical protein